MITTIVTSAGSGDTWPMSTVTCVARVRARMAGPTSTAESAGAAWSRHMFTASGVGAVVCRSIGAARTGRLPGSRQSSSSLLTRIWEKIRKGKGNLNLIIDLRKNKKHPKSQSNKIADNDYNGYNTKLKAIKAFFHKSFCFLAKSVEVHDKWFPVCPLALRPQPGSKGGSGRET